ncbi:MAG: PTS sugar transporter subunit IIA [Gemmatimonadota bacterium]|nr:PTS sugar transporter subunit IIA [Gemmatimonadota bacterium]
MSHPVLARLLSTDRVRIPIEARDKRGVIEEMCAFLADRAGVEAAEADAILGAVLDREEVLTTGIGGGVAIPHGRSESLDDLLLVAGRTAEPVDFEALDGRPVRLVMLLVGPESASGRHVQALSRIGRLLRSVSLRERLVDASTPEEFVEALRAAEAGRSNAASGTTS